MLAGSTFILNDRVATLRIRGGLATARESDHGETYPQLTFPPATVVARRSKICAVYEAGSVRSCSWFWLFPCALDQPRMPPQLLLRGLRRRLRLNPQSHRPALPMRPAPVAGSRTQPPAGR